MLREVSEHIRDGVSHLGQAAQEVSVVAVREDGTLARLLPVERPRHADGEALHAAGKSALVGRLNDQVQVVAQHGKVDEPEAAALASARKGTAERAEAELAAQVPDLGPDAQRDVDWKASGEGRPAAMGDPRAPLAAGVGARSSPAALAQRQPKLSGKKPVRVGVAFHLLK